MMDLDGAPYGGARYPVESILGGRTFVKFHLDVGIGDVVLDPPEQARMRDWFGFAGIAPPDVPMIQREQQFAEKLHALRADDERVSLGSSLTLAELFSNLFKPHSRRFRSSSTPVRAACTAASFVRRTLSSRSGIVVSRWNFGAPTFLIS